MHKIIITSTKFEGYLEFELQDDERVTVFRNHADLKQAQVEWLSSNFPMNLEKINQLIKTYDSLTGELVEMEITFDMFWDKYRMKRNKVRSERYWNKLTVADRLKAWNNIDPYFAYLARNPQQQKLYPDTYLNPVDRRFENEYK